MFDWQHEAEILASRYGGERMRSAIESLSEAYRNGRTTLAPRLDEELMVAAYLAVRFPATFAANLAADQAVAEAIETRTGIAEFAPASLLDLGAGCGAASLAALRIWPSLDTVTALEQIPAMVKLGKQMLPDAIWKTSKFEAEAAWATHDVVVCSYAYGEGRGDSALLAKAWKAASNLLILIEPGTPRGYAGLNEARTQLIAMGASILAPCPSHGECPARDLDWCHFPARLNRTALHRRLKGGSLGYEDEKYSYIAAWRGDLTPGSPRVIRHPLIEPGRIAVEVCDAPDRHKIVATKRNKPAFRQARKIAWGDVLAPIADAGPELPARDDQGTDAE
jgi:ribosomal protein RSM22 (predicted rRNA methylase)